MNDAAHDRHSLFLLLSLVVFFVLVPFLAHAEIGAVVVLGLFFIALVAAALEVSDQRSLLWVAFLLVACNIVTHLGTHFYPGRRPLIIASHILSLAYFGFVSVALFAYLGRPGVITRGRLYTSVSLYLILALFWFAVYNLMEVFAPGSFVQIAPTQATNLPRETLLYFSLATLTTLGYGDVVPASHPARGLATLESASGVLYIAITVARLVAAYQLSSDKDAS